MLDTDASEPAQPLGQQAYRRLVQRIVTGQLRGGTVLSERRLCAELGISRSPVRTALSRLEADGLAVRSGARTLQVRTVTVQDYLEALQVRRLLEPEAARLAAGEVDTRRIGELRGAIETMLAEPGPPSEHHWEIEEGLHASIAEASGNALLADAIKRVRNRGRLFDLRRMPQRFEPGCREHLAILDAVEAGDGPDAARCMRAHIDAIRASILDRLARH